MDLRERVILITGASSGIGEATARLLVERGASVVLGARRQDRLDALVERFGEHAAARRTDVSEPEDVRALVALAVERFGRLDAAFANAGFGGGGTVADGDIETWRSLLLTNVYGAALTAHYAVQPMIAAGEGHVVFISSVAGYIVPPNRNHMYSATKFAVRALADGLRKETVGKVRVTTISPGMVDSEFGEWPPGAMSSDEIANLVVMALEQPDNVGVNELVVRPLGQEF
jgi:NADP-dependent 3-hydroxy acid dehydrogenase YdfG